MPHGVDAEAAGPLRIDCCDEFSVVNAGGALTETTPASCMVCAGAHPQREITTLNEEPKGSQHAVLGYPNVHRCLAAFVTP
jgi:hypothetical protein